MKLVVCLSLTVAVAAFACSSSNSPGSPPGESQDGDAGADSTAPVTLDSSTPIPVGDDSSVPIGNEDSSTPSADSSTPPVADAGGDSATTPLSFDTDIYQPIIAKHCTGCHATLADGGAGSGVSFGKLDMTTVDAGYANLVNAPAAGSSCATVNGSAGPVRVIPGNAAGSLLYEKVNGFVVAPPCGGAMPKSGEIPDGGQAIVTAQIQAWINQGALP